MSAVEMHHGIEIPRDELAHFCHRNGIAKLSLFGSILREDFGPESDIDVLVEFEPEQRVGLIRIAALERELSQMLGRKVDLRTPEELSQYVRDEVVESAEVQYASR